MEYLDIINDPIYSQLQDKVETNHYGQIILTPHKPLHSMYQTKILKLLNKHEGGAAFPEMAVSTPSGTKIPDIVWCDKATIQHIKYDTTAMICPQICIEVWSDGNRNPERVEKPKIYFKAGAKEVWTCGNGKMRFFNINGILDRSNIFPDFPLLIDLNF